MPKWKIIQGKILTMTRVLCWQFCLLLIFSLFLAPFLVSAQVGSFDDPAPLSGYAWSGTDSDNNGSVDSGIGWISFNCSNDSSCGSVEYWVEIDDIDFSLNGYAWSSNIGWIKFGSGDFGTFNDPSGDLSLGATQSSGGQARVNATRDGLVGWARACSVFQSGCSGSLAPGDETGGWDGWISLSSVNTGGPSYGVAVNTTGGLESHAWGDDVISWVDFDYGGGSGYQVTFAQPCNPAATYCSLDQSEVLSTDQWCENESTVDTCNVGVGELCIAGSCATPAPIVATTPISVSALYAREGSTVTINWGVDETTADECQVVDNNGNVLQTDNTPPLAGPATSLPIDREVTVFTLQCMPTGFAFYLDVGTATTTILADVQET